jgi:hypothetical protein
MGVKPCSLLEHLAAAHLALLSTPTAAPACQRAGLPRQLDNTLSESSDRSKLHLPPAGTRSAATAAPRQQTAPSQASSRRPSLGRRGGSGTRTPTLTSSSPACTGAKLERAWRCGCARGFLALAALRHGAARAPVLPLCALQHRRHPGRSLLWWHRAQSHTARLEGSAETSVQAHAPPPAFSFQYCYWSENGHVIAVAFHSLQNVENLTALQILEREGPRGRGGDARAQPRGARVHHRRLRLPAAAL